MGRKGMKGFMKSASRSANKPEEEEAQQPADKVAPVQQAPSNSATTDHSNGKQSQSKESEIRAAGAEEQLEDEGDSKQETRGQMLQRHKRVWNMAGLEVCCIHGYLAGSIGYEATQLKSATSIPDLSIYTTC